MTTNIINIAVPIHTYCSLPKTTEGERTALNQFTETGDLGAVNNSGLVLDLFKHKEVCVVMQVPLAMA